jgi:replicative DNA helicase
LPFDLPPPQAAEAEEAYLGYLLSNPEEFLMFSGRVDSDEFFERPRQLVYEAMISVSERGQLPDFVTTVEELRHLKTLDSVGGASGVGYIIEAAGFPTRIEQYIDAIHGAYRRRRLIALSDKLSKACYSTQEDVGEGIDALSSEIVSLDPRSRKQDLISVGEVDEKYYEHLRTRRDVQKVGTGFENLDHCISEGFAPGKLVVLAGRTRNGKSVFAQNMIYNLCERGDGVFVSTQEMDFGACFDRIVSRATQIPLNEMLNLRDWQAEDPRKEKIIKFVDHVKSHWPVFFFDKRGVTFREAISQIYVAKQKVPNLKVAIFDLFDKFADVSVEDNTPIVIERKLNEAVTEAQRLGMCFVVVVQIARTAEESKNKRPEIRMLRYSSAYENSSDLILLLHRPKVYDLELTEDICELNIAKQRQGQQRVVKFLFDGDTMTFYPYTELF